MSATHTSKTLPGCLMLLVVLVVTAPALAMNDPVTGRWMTRDPLWYNNNVKRVRIPKHRRASKPARSLLDDQTREAPWGRRATRTRSPLGDVTFASNPMHFEYLDSKPTVRRDASGLSCDSHCVDAWGNAYLDCIDSYGSDPGSESICVGVADAAFSICVGNLGTSSCGGAPFGLIGPQSCCYPTTYTYLGVNANCMCKCMGNDSWSKRVRACLNCYYVSGCDAHWSHQICYEAADLAGFDRPTVDLLYCAASCAF